MFSFFYPFGSISADGVQVSLPSNLREALTDSVLSGSALPHPLPGVLRQRGGGPVEGKHSFSIHTQTLQKHACVARTRATLILPTHIILPVNLYSLHQLVRKKYVRTQK